MFVCILLITVVRTLVLAFLATLFHNSNLIIHADYRLLALALLFLICLSAGLVFFVFINILTLHFLLSHLLDTLQRVDAVIDFLYRINPQRVGT